LAALWWLLAGNDPVAWVVGVPTVTAAVGVSLWLAPARSHVWRLAGLSRFVPFFLWQALHGGLDVASRALRPGRPLEPAVLFRPWGLPQGTPRVLFANTVSLCPGTLSVGFDDRGLTLHVLDRRQFVTDPLAALEARVADVFGLPAPPGDRGSRG